jgi:hypothetical protein
MAIDWSFIFSTASLISCVFFFLYFRSYLRRRTGPDVLLAEFREEVYKLIAEIDSATDKDALLVEERIHTLRNLLEEVDKRISVHIREVDRRRVQEEAYAELGRKRRVIDSFSNAQANRRAPRAFELFPPATVAPPENADAPELPKTTPDSDTPPPPCPRIVVAERQIEPKPAPFAEQVAELSKAGLSAGLIAARLGVGIAEVELAIAISKG